MVILLNSFTKRQAFKRPLAGLPAKSREGVRVRGGELRGLCRVGAEVLRWCQRGCWPPLPARAHSQHFFPLSDGKAQTDHRSCRLELPEPPAAWHSNVKQSGPPVSVTSFSRLPGAFFPALVWASCYVPDSPQSQDPEVSAFTGNFMIWLQLPTRRNYLTLTEPMKNKPRADREIILPNCGHKSLEICVHCYLLKCWKGKSIFCIKMQLLHLFC